jgi:hypothetical protein
MKRKIVVTDHIATYNALINDISIEIDKNKKEMKNCSTRQLQSFLKRLVQLKKQVPYLSKHIQPPVEEGGKVETPAKHNHLQNLCKITPELAFFLQVPNDTLLRRSDIMTALCVYCHLNPDETRENVLKWKYLNPDCARDLRDKELKGGRIIPDEVLNDLLKYDEYTLAIREGKVFKNMRDKETGLKSRVPVTEECMFMWTLSKLVSKHIYTPSVEM